MHLRRPEDQLGPGGLVLEQWHRAVARPVTVGNLQKAVPDVTGEQIAEWLDQGTQGGANPITQAAIVLEVVLSDRPQEEAVAAIMADAALAQALGWDHIVPLLAAG